MNPSPLILILAPLIGTQAHAASATSDKSLSGILAVAKRLDASQQAASPDSPPTLSDVPMSTSLAE